MRMAGPRQSAIRVHASLGTRTVAGSTAIGLACWVIHARALGLLGTHRSALRSSLPAELLVALAVAAVWLSVLR